MSRAHRTEASDPQRARAEKAPSGVRAARCPDCGATVTGGREGCQAFFDEVIAVRAYTDPRVAVLRDLALDAYCMQHVERYGRSAKSYAAHLTRLCCWLEHGGNPRVLAAIRTWLDGPVRLQKPDILLHLGDLTIADVRAGEELATLVRAWAEDVWKAYAPQHDLARTWIRAATTAVPTIRGQKGH